MFVLGALFLVLGTNMLPFFIENEKFVSCKDTALLYCLKGHR